MELLIVIIIIGILMLLGLGLNWSNLKALKSKTAIEEIKSGFDTFFLQVINSSSLGQAPYRSAQITFSKVEGESAISSSFDLEQERSDEAKNLTEKGEKNLTSENYFSQIKGIEITKLLLNDKEEKEKIHLLYQPYDLKCQMRVSLSEQIGDEKQEDFSDQLFFSLLPKGGNEVCFQLDEHYCKMQSVSCETNLSEK